MSKYIVIFSNLLQETQSPLLSCMSLLVCSQLASKLQGHTDMKKA